MELPWKFTEEVKAASVCCAGGPGGGSTGGSLGGLAVPFLRGGHLRSRLHRSYSVGLANSPVNGLLYVRGTLGVYFCSSWPTP